MCLEVYGISSCAFICSSVQWEIWLSFLVRNLFIIVTEALFIGVYDNVL